jgi:alginate O-acetyltransferase complex protein AlgI
MGFDLMLNFRQPYFAMTPSEFWRRWHISLSTWLRDYLYIPLGGSRHGQVRTLVNLNATMILGGLWHGAAWTFVLWGVYHGFLLSLHRVLAPLVDRFRLLRYCFSWKLSGVAKCILLFHLVCLGWLLFRAQSVGQFMEMMRGVVCEFEVRRGTGVERDFWDLVRFTGLFAAIQWLQFSHKDQFAVLKVPVWIRAVLYFVMYHLILTYGVEGGKEFIYFQF